LPTLELSWLNVGLGLKKSWTAVFPNKKPCRIVSRDHHGQCFDLDFMAFSKQQHHRASNHQSTTSPPPSCHPAVLQKQWLRSEKSSTESKKTAPALPLAPRKNFQNNRGWSVSPSQVRCWWKKREEIRAASASQMRLKGGGAKPQLDAIEDVLFNLILQRRAMKLKVSRASKWSRVGWRTHGMRSRILSSRSSFLVLASLITLRIGISLVTTWTAHASASNGLLVKSALQRSVSSTMISSMSSMR
jgi:hypothetical protein